MIVAGPRARVIPVSLTGHTAATARAVVDSRQAVVSGGARGIDRTAMRAALDQGGQVAGVLADSLERAALARENREFLIERRLVLVSPFDPGAGFNVGHAMQRNKLVYALADAALVVSSDHNKGGTWAGAVEQLEKLHFVCVYVRSVGNITKGIGELIKKGALPWPEPRDASAMNEALHARPRSDEHPLQAGLPFSEAGSKAEVNRESSPSTPEASLGLGEELFAKATELLLQLLARPMTADEICRELEVNREQATQWVERLVETGSLVRPTPTTYCTTMPDKSSDAVAGQS